MPRILRLPLLILTALAGLYALATQLPSLRAFDARWTACKAADGRQTLLALLR